MRDVELVPAEGVDGCVREGEGEGEEEGEGGEEVAKDSVCESDEYWFVRCE